MKANLALTTTAILMANNVVVGLPLNQQDQSQQRILKLKTKDQFESPDRNAPWHDTCPVDSPLSCSKQDSMAADSCCYESTNGVFLLAQLWDYKPAIGANDTFTLHGLWCDKCKGGYNQFCNPGWEISSVEEALKSTGNQRLLNEMRDSWLSLNGNHEHLWLHEFNKHGTCMSTASPECYDKDASKYQYAADFFTTSMDIWRELPTFQWLQEAGIEPSEKNTYTVEQFQDALASKLDVDRVAINCKRNALTEVYYYFNLKGSVANGQFVPRDAFNKGSCKDGFRWLPKGSNGGGGNNPPDKNAKRGYLKLSGQQGCLISNGHWYTSGTCATFRKRKAQFGGIHLSTSKGPCDVKDGELSCNSGNKPGQFTETEDGDIIYGGETKWSADKQPHATVQEPIRPGDDGDITFELKFVPK